MVIRSLGLRLLFLSVFLAATACDASPTSDPPSTPGAVTYSREVDGYMVVAPEVLRSGQTHDISVSLLRGSEPAEGTVQLTLSEAGSGRVIARADRSVLGSRAMPLRVPPEAGGSYTLTVSGEGDRRRELRRFGLRTG